MLPGEIDPAAQVPMEDLKNIRTQLEAVLSGQNGILTEGNLTIWIAKLKTAERTLERFRVCMADEVKQKETMRDRWMELRFPK
jgi:hypothetical protein